MAARSGPEAAVALGTAKPPHIPQPAAATDPANVARNVRRVIWSSPEKVDTVNLLLWRLSAGARSRWVSAFRAPNAYAHDCRNASDCQLPQPIPPSFETRFWDSETSSRRACK